MLIGQIQCLCFNPSVIKWVLRDGVPGICDGFIKLFTVVTLGVLGIEIGIVCMPFFKCLALGFCALFIPFFVAHVKESPGQLK